MGVDPEWELLLGRLAINDDNAIGSIFADESSGLGRTDLDDKTRALVRLAALIALESAAPSYQRAVGIALSAGATETDVVGVLLCTAPIVGSSRVISAAPGLAAALGCDLDRRLEG